MTTPPRIPILKLIIWSLVIGLMLSFFKATPEGVYAWAGETGRVLFKWIWGLGQNIGPYVLLGAILVLPIWGVLYLWKWLKKSRKA